MNFDELKEFLDEKVLMYNQPSFIYSDPIQIPHTYQLKEDIEISGFFASTFAWGNRKMIIQKTKSLMERMGNSPYDFVMNYNANQLPNIENFKHRTFNHLDLDFYLRALQNIYANHGGLENVFLFHQEDTDTTNAIRNFRDRFLEVEHLARSSKHLSNPDKGSSCKRLNMMLRWFCRKDKQGVDLGIWDNAKMSQLSCPLDVHSGNVARKLGLLTRKQNDTKALQELDLNLRKLDAKDPVKYDFALFGLGVFEQF